MVRKTTQIVLYKHTIPNSRLFGVTIYWFAIVMVVVVVVFSTPEEKYIEVCQKTSNEITFMSPGSISEGNSMIDLRKGGARMWIGFSWIGMRSDCWLCEHTRNYGLIQSRNIVATHKGYIRATHCSRRLNCTVPFLATDTEVPGSIPGATRFSE